MSEHPTRILIVDDDPIVAESIAEFLAGIGYHTATANSGEEGLQAVEDAERAGGNSGRRTPDPFSVVLTDVSMHGMDGLELIATLRDKHPDVVPVVITGYGTIEAAVKSIRLGAVDYLTKPIVDDELRV